MNVHSTSTLLYHKNLCLSSLLIYISGVEKLLASVAARRQKVLASRPTPSSENGTRYEKLGGVDGRLASLILIRLHKAVFGVVFTFNDSIP
jgi:hypothetical protein